MKISWYGQSFIEVVTNTGCIVLFDPFITGNPMNDLDPKTVKANVIVVTHAHADHIGDTQEIAKRNKALIVTTVEIAEYFERKQLRTHGMQMGGKHLFDFGEIKMTPAIHGSSYEIDGKLTTIGLAAGIIFHSDNKTIYHAGDTALFSDMKLIGQYRPLDVAFLPIGDNFTMGPEDAAIAAKYLQAKQIVPIHYNTFPLIEQDPIAFSNRLADEQGKVLKVGEILEL